MNIGNTLHFISSLMEEPVMWSLLILLIVSVLFIGSFAGEFVVRKLRNKYDVSELIEKIHKSKTDEIEEIIKKSKMTNIQVSALIKVISVKDLSEQMRIEAAQSILSETETRYEKTVGYTDIIIKIAPVAGLMGTLIPLGPGIMALGGGDIQTLSESIMSAFDTTVVGLVSAAAATVVSAARKIWYKKYIADTESVMECILEKLRNEGEAL